MIILSQPIGAEILKFSSFLKHFKRNIKNKFSPLTVINYAIYEVLSTTKHV